MKKRKYTLKQRAAQQQHTRERIVDAAMTLHEEIGPAETTVSALAERAGVQRLTVYRHFPDEDAILQACSAKWFGLHPPPDIATIPAGDPISRTRSTLASLYTYYEQNQRMWTSLYRDLGRSTSLAAAMEQFDAYLGSLLKALLGDWRPARSTALRATLGHALQFSTWQSLSNQGLGQRALTDLVCKWIINTAQAK